MLSHYIPSESSYNMLDQEASFPECNWRAQVVNSGKLAKWESVSRLDLESMEWDIGQEQQWGAEWVTSAQWRRWYAFSLDLLLRYSGVWGHVGTGFGVPSSVADILLAYK